MQAAQMSNQMGQPLNVQAAQQIRQIDQMVMAHVQAHQAALGNEQQTAAGRPGGGGATGTAGAEDLMGQVQSNAQKTSQAAQAQSDEMVRGS